jgi:hypothetical protein
VVILVAVPAAHLWTIAIGAWRERRQPGGLFAAAAVGVGLAVLVLVATERKPTPDPDGGWAAAAVAGRRVATVAAGRPVAVLGLPEFKLPDAIGFPVAYEGSRLVDSGTEGALIVVACDRLFEAAIGAPCGGGAEENLIGLGRLAGDDRVLLDRFDASPRTLVSIYGPPPTP